MAEEKEREKTLEMRVAELEDKLKGLQVTEEEMRAFHKVASLMGGQAAAAPAGPTQVPSDCVIAQCVRSCVITQCVRSCVISQCIRTCVISQCIRTCIVDCINECGGGWGPGGGLAGAGGFGTLGG